MACLKACRNCNTYINIQNINIMRKITSLLTLLLLCVVGASAQITSLSEITTTGIYTIKCERGAWIADATNNKLLSTIVNNATISADDENQQWQFEDVDASAGTCKIKSYATSTYITGPTASNQLDLTSEGGTYTLTSTGSGFFIDAASGDRLNFATATTWYPNGYSVDWWKTQDGGNNFVITKVGDTEAQAHDVTYTVTMDGETVATVTQSHFAGDAAALSSDNQKDFVTYTYSVSTIEESTTDVTVTATANLPFTVSTSYSDATWYYAKFNANLGGGWAYDGDANPNVKTPTDFTYGDDNCLWAFIGNPYKGFTIINKAAGDGKYLATKTGAATDAEQNPGGNTYAVMTTSDDTENTLKTWTIAAWSSISGGFTLANEEGVRLNRRSANNLAHWTGADAGSVVSVTEYADDILDVLVAKYGATYGADVTPVTGGYFQMTTESYNSIKTAYQAIVDAGSCDATTYYEFVATAATQAYKYPADGYYRIKSSGKRGATTYIAVGSNYYGRGDKATGYGLKTVDESTAASDASTYIKFTKVSDGVYKLSTEGEGVVSPSAYNQPFLLTAAEDEGNNFNFTGRSNGYVNIKDATLDSYGYLHEGDWGTNNTAVVKWEADAEASWWTVEDVEGLTVALHQAGEKYYATLNLPFGATVTGATAYTAALSTEGSWLELTEVSDIKANTPVVLIGDSESATISLKTDATGTAADNALTGTNVAMDWVSTYFTLGKVEDVAGFYLWGGTTLGANKAYYVNTDAAVKGYAFGNSTTGIQTVITSDTLQGAIYDLQGRRVQKAQSGLYIVGGKKVFVK